MFSSLYCVCKKKWMYSIILCFEVNVVKERVETKKKHSNVSNLIPLKREKFYIEGRCSTGDVLIYSTNLELFELHDVVGCFILEGTSQETFYGWIR